MTRQKLYDALQDHLGDVDTSALDHVPEVTLKGIVLSLDKGDVSANEFPSLSTEAAPSFPSLNARKRSKEESGHVSVNEFPALSAQERINELQH